MSEEFVKSELKKLNLDYKCVVIQQKNPVIVCLEFAMESVLSVLGVGNNIADAQEQAFKKAYIFIKVCMEDNTKQWNLAALTLASGISVVN